jgi:hypothetical protein
LHEKGRCHAIKAFIFKNMAHDMLLEENWKDVADYIVESI